MDENGSVAGTAGKVAVAAPWNVVARGLTALFSIGFSMAVVRGLGEYDYGRYGIVQTALGFFTIFYTFGMTEALLKFVPATRGARPGAGRRVIVMALSFQTAAWLLLLVLAAGAAGLIDGLYRVPIGALLVLGVALGLLSLLFETICVVYTGLYLTRAVAWATLVARAVSLGLVIVAMYADWGVAGALCALGAGSAVGALAMARGFLLELGVGGSDSVKGQAGRVRHETGAGGERVHKRPDEKSDGLVEGFTANRLLKYTLPLVGRSFLGQIIWRQSEALIIGFFWGPIYAGFFHLGYNFPQRILEFIPLAIWPLVLAGLSEVQSRREEDLPGAIRLYYRFLFLLVIPLAVFGVTLGDKAMILLYGQDMAQAGNLCRFFFAVFVIAFLGTPLHMATYVLEKTWANLAVGVVGAVITLGLDLIMIPRYGIYGAIFPTALGLIVTNWLQYRIAVRYMPGLSVPWRHLGRVLLASAPILMFYPLRSWADGPGGLGAICFGMLLAFAGAARALRVVGAEEKRLLETSPWRAVRAMAWLLAR